MEEQGRFISNKIKAMFSQVSFNNFIFNYVYEKDYFILFFSYGRT